MLLEKAPTSVRSRIALRLLSLSPHYFWGKSGEFWISRNTIKREHQRNRESRRQLFEEVVLPHVRAEHTVLDYGCGPGYLAAATAKVVHQVVGCDISAGALACARTLNPGVNIRYVDVTTDGWSSGIMADVAYSFAVAQHVRDTVLQQILRTVREMLKPGGLLLMHVIIDAPGWRSEADWLGDNSMVGRVKLKYGLNCFSRTADQVIGLAETAGFHGCQIKPMSEFTFVDDDIAREHILIARV